MEWSRIDRLATAFTVVVVMLIGVAGCIEPIPADPQPYCGDGVCQMGESCEADCGSDVPSGSFLAEYYTGQFDTFVTSRNDATIDFDWGQGAPIEDMDVDYFSARWTGRFGFNDDDYMFTASVDDGIRIYVDGALVLESWQNQPDTTYTATVPMTAGEHEIMVEYYEAHSSASVTVSWAPADQAVTDPGEPAFDGTYGARPVPASRDVTIAANRRTSDVFVTPNPSSSADCSYEDPCSLGTGLGRSGHLWLNPGTYYPGGQISLGSDRTLESIDPDDKAVIDFRDRSLGISVSGDDNVLRNIIVRGSTKDGILITGNRNLFHGVVSEHNYGSGFYVYRNWEMSIADTSRASYNMFQDCVANYNNDNCKGTGAETCFDGDADGIGFSAGVGNVIDHCEASYNSDDGFDFWMSYKSTITNSIAYRNGYDDAAGYEAGLRRGNGNGFKMGPGPIQAPDGSTDTDHVVVANWANENALRTFDENGGENQEFSDNVCHPDQEPCGWWE